MEVRRRGSKISASINNNQMFIDTMIVPREKLIKLGLWEKKKKHVRGGDELKKFLKHLLNRGLIEGGYTMRVISPEPIEGKTINNTYRMYQRIGFKRIENILEEKVEVLIKHLQNIKMSPQVYLPAVPVKNRVRNYEKKIQNVRDEIIKAKRKKPEQKETVRKYPQKPEKKETKRKVPRKKQPDTTKLLLKLAKDLDVKINKTNVEIETLKRMIRKRLKRLYKM